MEQFIDLKPGQWVTAQLRWSKSMKCLIPGFSGVVRAIRPWKNEIDIVEFGSHGTRTTSLDNVRALRGKSKQMEKHIAEIQDIPRFRSPGGRDIPEESASSTSLGELVIESYITNLTREAKERKKMAKGKNATVDNGFADEKPKKEKAKKASKAVSLSGVTPEDFFMENAKGKSVFRPGWDAKFAACLKRVAQGTADADDRRIAKSKVILNHPKVAESAHFRHLLEVVTSAA